MYISEISPKKYRGAFGALNSWTATFGLLLSSVLSFQEILGNEQHWQHLFTVLLVFAAIQFLTLSVGPETPQFLLIEQNKKEAASQVMVKLRSTNFDVDADLEEIVQEDEKTKSLPEICYRDFFRKW